MTYKFNEHIDRFTLDVTDFDLVAYFSINKYKLAYFFIDDVFIGYISRKEFHSNGCHFSKEILRKDYIKDFSNYIDDHQKIIDYFVNTKAYRGIVINQGVVKGEFELIKTYQRAMDSERKIGAFKKLEQYEDIFKNYLLKINKKVGILFNPYYDFHNSLFDVVPIERIDEYDIVLDGFIDEVSVKLYENTNIIPIDEFLACALLEKIKSTPSLKENLYFFNISLANSSPLFEDEKERLVVRNNLKSVLLDDDFIKKAYGDYPKDYEYITNLKTDLNKSVILGNNGVYHYVRDSIVLGDINITRVVPSFKKTERTINFYGPCIAYGICTSRFSTIEELVQQELNKRNIDCSCVNYGVPIGVDYLNDLFIFIYNKELNNSINVFMNIYGNYIKKYLIENDFQYFECLPDLEKHHYWFFDNELHLTPLGNQIMSDIVLSRVDFSNIYQGNSLLDLQRIQLNDSYYLIQNDLDGYKKYLKESKFSHKGKVGMIDINANPFTNGHAYLIDYALKHCDYLYVFVVEDNQNAFPFYDRFSLIKEYCQKYDNVRVLTGGAFIGSKYTVTAYFYREYNMKLDPKEDIQNFKNILDPILNIDVRFMGEEKDSVVTNDLNNEYSTFMKSVNKELIIIPRLEIERESVSASKIREALYRGDFEYIKKRVPKHVYEYLLQINTDKEIYH